MEDITNNETSGYIKTSDTTASKPRTKRAKALEVAECVSCKKYGWDKNELDAKIVELSKLHNVNQVASMLRVHSQYVKEVLNIK